MTSPLILNLSTQDVRTLGGLARTVLDVEKVLTASGFRVCTLSPQSEDRLRPHLLHQLFGHIRSRWLTNGEARALLQEGAALLIGHNGAGWGLRGVPRITCWQNESGEYALWTWPRWHPNHWKLRVVDPWTERRAAAGSTVVAVSERMAGNLRDFACIDVAEVIENAVDTRHFRPLGQEAGEAFRIRMGLPPRPAVLLLFAGRPVDYKGLPLLADWARRFADRLHVVLAGPDTSPPPFRSLANVHALGRISYDDLPALYAAADFFALPSAHEGCSYAAIEAAACGVPSLLSDAGHVRTLARRCPVMAPWIAPTNRRERLTETLAQWLDNPSIPSALREPLRADALAHHSMDHFARRWTRLVQRLHAT